MTANKHDDLGSDLGQAMRDQVEGLGGAGLTLDDVKGTASRIRRRQAWTAGAAIAAVLAIAVPTALTTTGGLGDPDRDQTPATTTPSQTTTPKQVGAPGQPLDTRDLPLGAEPQVTWLEGTTLHQAQGDDVELPGRYLDVVPFDDGWLAVGISQAEGARGQLFDSDREPIGEDFSSAYSLAVSDDSDLVLYVRDGNLLVHDNATGEDEGVRSADEATEPIGFSGDAAYYNVGGQQGLPTGFWFRDGTERQGRPGTFFYRDVTEDGWTIGVTEATDTGSCSVTVAPNGDVVGRTCDFGLDQFSPDGGHVLAEGAYSDGYADGELAVLGIDPDAAKPVLHLLQSGERDAGFMDYMWEDDQHVLVVTATPIQGTSDRMFQIVRVGLDGTVENAAEPVRAAEFDNPFTLLRP